MRHPAEWQHWIEACPPVPGEVMQVPIGEARRWLNASATGDIADIEGRGGKESEAHGDLRPFRIWRNGEVCAVGEQPRPGDTIIVAAREGGADRWGWNPASHPASDRCRRRSDGAGRQAAHPAPDRAGRHRCGYLLDYAELSDRAVREDLHARGLLDAARGKLLRRLGTGIGLPWCYARLMQCRRTMLRLSLQHGLVGLLNIPTGSSQWSKLCRAARPCERIIRRPAARGANARHG